MQEPHLIWDCATAYDLFVSLVVLHEPSKYGLRGAWAKGVRARIPAHQREILEQTISVVFPFRWVHSLPEPKNSATVLRVLEEVPAADRLFALVFSPKIPAQAWEIFQTVAIRGGWDESDRAALQPIFRCLKSSMPKTGGLEQLLEWWSHPEAFGERYLEALSAYYEVFFAEEEGRILPALEDALGRAKILAERLDLPALLEDLSLGLRLTELPQVSELVLAPSFWSTPLLVFSSLSEKRDLILFGARPVDASLVPGEVVPDGLMRALKALGDPTRLRILRHLTAEPLSPAQLARRLRLRAPTVIHHLDALRVAELVHLTLKAGGERRYAARPNAATSTLAALLSFLTHVEQTDSQDVD